jgi:Leucine-rich repeat (LRR) protein
MMNKLNVKDPLMRLLSLVISLILTYPVIASGVHSDAEPYSKRLAWLKYTDAHEEEGQLVECSVRVNELSRLEGMTSLRKLKVEGTKFRDGTYWRELSQGTEQLGTLTQLTDLNISDMSYNDDIGTGEKCDHRIRYPKDGEQLPYLIPLMNLTCLVKLDVSDNNLGRFVNFVRGLSLLTHLNISHNFHEGEPEQHHVDLTCLIGLSRLTNLGCRNNYIADEKVVANLTVLSRLPLVCLDLGGTNNFGPETVSHIATITTLVELDLSSRPNNTAFFLKPIGLNHVGAGTRFLTTLINLTHLNLLGNEIDDNSADALGPMTKLQSLNLSKNKLTRRPTLGVMDLTL